MSLDAPTNLQAKQPNQGTTPLSKLPNNSLTNKHQSQCVRAHLDFATLHTRCSGVAWQFSPHTPDP